MPTVSEILGAEAGPDIADNPAKFALNDILAQFDARGYKIGSLTISPSTGEALPSAGAFILEQHNDASFTGAWHPVPHWDAASTSPWLASTAISATALAARCFALTMTNLRIRVSTALTARPARSFIRVWLEPHSGFAPGVANAMPVLQPVAGTAAEDAAASGNPVMAAGKVRTANLATLVAGDVATLTQTTSAQQLVKEGHLPELDWSFAPAAGGIINTTDVVAKVAAGAGLRNYVYSMQVKNANAVAGEFVIKDGATIMWRGHLAASMLYSDVLIFRPPLKGTANAAVNVACITTGQQVYANVQGGVGV